MHIESQAIRASARATVFVAASTTVKAAARPPQSKLAFSFGGYVAFGELGAFAEEELLHLLFHDFL